MKIEFIDLRQEPMIENYRYAVCSCHTSFFVIRLPKDFSGRFNCPNCNRKLGFYQVGKITIEEG